ncbi:MAG: hypothetical protein JRI23_23605 [Deltaproteobacteria bacterium]|jgi:hypothetical protein|nr:hypothetical protein [Deltaproteobacteria bacterium]MBW2534977.1 hypothetical protein [Deltaproteobacteria bacterium]
MRWWSGLSQAYVDTQIRKRLKLCETPLDRYQVRIARTAEEYRDAFALVHVAYAYLGIESVRKTALRITPQHLLPEATVFIAYEGDQPVGTMTVTIDSPAGLPLDGDYPAELDRLRAEGLKLVEYGSLSVVHRCRHTGVPVLLAMAANCWAHARGGDQLVIGVHPRAAAYYRALYAFSLMGQPQRHQKLAAPVCGLTVPIERSIDHLRRTAAGLSAEGIPTWRHFVDCPPSCVDLTLRQPADPAGRDRLPREVFRTLFIQDTDRLETLDANTRDYLASVRSEATLGDTTPDWLPELSESFAPEADEEVPTPPPSAPRLRSGPRAETTPRHSYIRELRTAPARRRKAS